MRGPQSSGYVSTALGPGIDQPYESRKRFGESFRSALLLQMLKPPLRASSGFFDFALGPFSGLLRLPLA